MRKLEFKTFDEYIAHVERCRDEKVTPHERCLMRYTWKDAQLLIKTTSPYISVDDRLPEDGQEVIVKVAGKHNYFCYYNELFSEWVDATTSVNLSPAKQSRVTHWMPIPELSKE